MIWRPTVRKSAAFIRPLIALAIVLSGAFVSGAALAVDGQPPVQVQMTEEGPVYANRSGMTLYSWAGDVGRAQPRCTHARYTERDLGLFGGVIPLPATATRKTCADKWPPFIAGPDAKASGDWSLIVREGGVKQWSYQGRPLYTSMKDRRPGDLNGESIANRLRIGWKSAKAPVDLPPGFKLIRRAEGLVLATSDGRPAYIRRGGRPQRVCSGCTELLQPLVAPDFGRLAGRWSIMDVGGGRKQYAYDGAALYVLPEGMTDDDLQGVGGWSPAVYRRTAGAPPQLRIRMTIMGRIFTTEDGRTLYSFACAEAAPDQLACDDPGDAASYWSAICGDAKACSQRWRPYLASPNARPVGEWTIEEVSDPPFLDPAGTTYPPDAPRVRAWAYRGKPLYTFSDDDEPGRILGSDMNGGSSFYVILVPGEPLEAS